MLYNQVLSFTAPERRALKANRHVLAKSCGWKYRQDMLIDDNLGHHLNEENEEDLCALKALPKPDRLTRLFEGKLAFLFRVSSHVLLWSCSITVVAIRMTSSTPPHPHVEDTYPRNRKR